jgi:hypothetical protein
VGGWRDKGVPYSELFSWMRYATNSKLTADFL